MLTDLQRDILIKSAEGIQEGMWCTGEWFTNSPLGDEDYDEGFQNILPDEIFDEHGKASHLAQVEKLTGMYRCAEGELMLRTIILGGGEADFFAVEGAVGKAIIGHCETCAERAVKNTEEGCSFDIFDHNDSCTGALDAFTAGQEWAEIFRSVL